jgi:two-component system nitrogen regulation sensor histidine kinase GlnL
MTNDAAAGTPRPQASFDGLDLLPTAVLVLDDALNVRYANPAAEALLDTAMRSLLGQPFLQLFAELPEQAQAVHEALEAHWNYAAQNVSYLRPGREPLQLACLVTRTEVAQASYVVELRSIEQMLRIVREERLLSEQQAHRELIRNLAHEIRNPVLSTSTRCSSG